MLPLEDWKKIYSQVPRSCVDIVLTRDDGRVLITKRAEAPWKDYWHFPGGTVRKGERSIDAVRRLLQEELRMEGIAEFRESSFLEEYSISPALATIEFLGSPEDPDLHVISQVFTLSLRSGGTLEAGDRTSQIEWVDPVKPLPQLFVPQHANVLKLLVQIGNILR